MEHFFTIQGEGVHSGKAAYFIRLAGCDVGCVWCDVKESWTQGYPIHKAKEMADWVINSKASLVVVTGGEPLMHDCKCLTEELHKANLELNIETSGAYPLTGDWDWICLSPKKFVKPLPEIYGKAHELKVIIFNKTDLKWAEEQAINVNGACQLLLQPEWSRESEMLPLIIDYVKQNPKWKISLQTHKYMNIP
ncbi:MAG: 7-carboxy-7-deazaguanine synthase QueE [Bacteroidia bacterium]